jgi:tetratricopeptide (TPR) repeat protein
MAHENDEVSASPRRPSGNPGNAELHYLLGAELAQAGRYEAAAAEMTRALELKPNLHTARLQLGLLYLTLRQPQRSLAIWQPLEALGSASCLALFKQGLEALIRDDFGRCVSLLEAGIRANTDNAPLNGDMERIVHKAREALSQGKPGGTATEDAADVVRSDFSLYGQ